MAGLIDHVAAVVKDLEGSVGFYTRVLGFTLVRRAETPDLKVAFVQLGETKVELMELKHPIKVPAPTMDNMDVGLKHLAFQVEDVAKKVAELKEKGVRFTSEPKGPDFPRSAFFRDPSGVILQLIQWK